MDVPHPSVINLASSSQPQGLEEDLINRSLLDSLEAQGDAEPSLLSPSQQFPMAQPSSKQDPEATSPDAAEANDFFLRASHFPHHIDSNNLHPNPESLFTQNDPHSLYNSANNIHLTPDYPSDPDNTPIKQPSSKSPNDLGAGPFRSSFVPFSGINGAHSPNNSVPNVPPSSFRMRQHEGLLSGSQSFGNATEVYGSHQPLGLKHQLSQQGVSSSSAFETRSADYGPNVPLSTKPSQPFTMDPFVQSHSAKLQSQPHDSFHPLSHNPSAPQPPYLNGVHVQSQTPYGPHLQSNGNPRGAGSAGQPNSAIDPPGNQQEEISTIFVVGFPDDMQEREFQNMFTFSSGFEAATLKIPNKEYTAYGTGGTASNLPFRGGQSYTSYLNSGQNDPYNIVTVNQGGVVVDNGRDGPTTSWPPLAMQLPDDPGHFQGGSGGQPSRKQIIGFAKFRTRQEALDARDVLQGRRIDVEKGAVLKAEMAKKNLHTKRGVGIGNTNPSGNNGINTLGSLGPNIAGLANLNGISVTPDALAGLTAGLGLNANLGLNSLGGSDPHPVREATLSAMGYRNLGGGWRDGRLGDSSEEERDRDEREKRKEALAMGLSATRGARERALAEEEFRRKDVKPTQNDTLRVTPTHASPYDAFYSVSSSRGSQTGFLSPNANPLNGDGPQSNQAGSPFPGNGYGTIIAQTSLKDDNIQIPTTRDVSIGPWDVAFPRERESLAYSGLSLYATRKGPAVPARPPSSQDESPMSNLMLDDEGMLPAHRSSVFRSTQFFGSADEPAQSQGARPSLSVSSAASSAGATPEGEGPVPLVVSTSAKVSVGSTSPQLPSPASNSESGVSSGGHAGSPSSAGGANASGGPGPRSALVDQNPPINTLYVGNLPTGSVGAYPTGVLEENLRELFSRRPGYRKLCFRQKSNGPMCFVEFEDVHHATKALNELYGHPLGGLVKNGGIRLSYSKNPLGVRTPTSAGAGSSQQQQNVQLAKTSALPAEAFQQRQGFEVDSSVTVNRRETPNAASFSYSRSPPPRFFSPPPSGSFGAVASAAPLNTTAFPRGSHSFGLSLGGSGGPTNFSPFSLPPSSPPARSNAPSSHSIIPDHTSTEATLSHGHPQHFPLRTLSPSSATLEAARAG